jgi:hypothetical protein
MVWRFKLKFNALVCFMLEAKIAFGCDDER